MPGNVMVDRSRLDSLAEVVAAKSGSGIPLTLDQMREAVLGIGSVGGAAPTGTKTITTNGTHDVADYENAGVRVLPKLATATVEPTEDAQTVTAPSGKDGLSRVTVLGVSSHYVGSNVPRLYSRYISPSKNESVVAVAGGTYVVEDVVVRTIPSQYVIPTGELNISEDGYYNVYNYSGVRVTRRVQTKTVSSSFFDQSVTADSGYTGLSSVSVSAMPYIETMNSSGMTVTIG